MKKIYRVVKHTHYEKGEINKEHYTVQCQSNFLWWKLWGNITEMECYNGDCENYPITFNTETEATNMIINLQNGNKLTGWEKEIITVVK